ncbi:DUF2141 domain-containing protein [Erythrobacter sp. LQ02-29]|uniref:DUF2141 domain-containing protein n=1 Tax=unclassified Erythrobacter TaxID=2633097 RepID=UPI001BFC52A6|nr:MULTISPECIES: DUF2141 domain-containing protein [unclassified Erythrobacter]MCP9223427.1 DUF2141 domain-containing protein [Erythrobacter sp. LQ02-29]QWC57962.1 DUF2141 domain-containing protein [Erythrobacter sp. 3-20A1M]
MRYKFYGAGALAAVAALLTTASPALSETRTPNRQCTAGAPSITVTVSGFKNNTGTVRAQLYGPDANDFLDKGEWAMRIEERRSSPGTMRFCFPIDKPGRYAVAVRHDANNNGKSDWNDGGGFTGNPKLSLLDLKPKFSEAAVTVGSSPVRANIVMQYRQGLSIKPI